ncbi:MAG: hypothetical protein L0287_10120 [Anaerolineae bacterium]|nr:hypothetical protein [Anaerolineae bacterium]
MNELWLFVEHGKQRTWTRAFVPASVATVRDLINYLQRGGQVRSDWMDVPERAKYSARAVSQTVIATLQEARS